MSDKPNLKQYAVWSNPELEADSGFWIFYDTLDDAALENEGAEIYEVNFKACGKYTVKTVLVKSKKESQNGRR